MGLNEILTSPQPPKPGEWHLSSREMNKFFWKYKGLLKESERDNSFWLSTNDNLSNAYERLDTQERQLEKAYGINRKYLDNIKEGLLLIDQNFMILDQYSVFLEQLFQTKNIAGKNLVDFLFPDSEASALDRKTLEKYLSILFKNTIANQEMLAEMNPLVEKEITLKIEGKSGGKIIVNAEFIRIPEKNSVGNIMVIFEDITHITKIRKELQDEKEKHEEEIESISAIIKAGPQSFQGFLSELANVIGQLQSYLEYSSEMVSIDVLFRNLHSLKGTSKYLNLNFISSLSHKIEDLLMEFKNKTKEITEADLKNEIRKGINSLQDAIQNINAIKDKFANFSALSAEMSCLNEEALLNNFLQSLKEMALDISKAMNKDISLHIKNTLTEFPYLEEIKSPVIHLIRNAADHGIEDRSERLSGNKNPQGNIWINFYQEGNHYLIEIADDGRGINFEEIRKKAMEKNLIPKNSKEINRLELLKILFLPAFSTKKEVTEISGRGYGMDIVKDTIHRLKGRISIATETNKGTKVMLKIPVK